MVLLAYERYHRPRDSIDQLAVPQILLDLHLRNVLVLQLLVLVLLHRGPQLASECASTAWVWASTPLLPA
jgi:hypothetical protein